MYFICSGVLQGCPLNYLLFNISADPLVNTLANMDDKDGSMSRWCADDGGTALRSYRQLAVLDAIFKKLSPLTGHFLNTGKIIYHHRIGRQFISISSDHPTVFERVPSVMGRSSYCFCGHLDGANRWS